MHIESVVSPRRALIPVCIAILACLPASPSRAASAPEIRWMTYALDGHPVGYIVDTLLTGAGSGAATFRTRQGSEVVINRLGNKVAIRLGSETEEDEGGRLTRLAFWMSMSGQRVHTRLRVDGDSLRMRQESGGRSYDRVVARPAEVLGPEGIRTRSRDGLRRPGDRIVYHTFAAELGMLVEATRTADSVAGNAVRARETLPGLADRVLWLDADGRMARLEDTGPFGRITIAISDRATALAALAGDALPEEMFERTVIRSNVRLPQARALDQVTAHLRRRIGNGWPDLSRAGQTARLNPDSTLTVTISRPRGPARSIPLPPSPAAGDEAFLAPNAIVTSDDPAVVRIARAVTSGEHDAWRAAQSLRRWVSDSLRFDLGVALAPASEVARDRRGTCAAYASLLTALCRAAGIPARYVMGFVYHNGAWGGHAWTEVHLGDAWLPVDAALPSDGVADAARLAFASGSLADGAGSLIAPGARLYGQIDIVVTEYALDGRRVAIAEGPLYRIESGHYHNLGLGLRIQLPQGWHAGQLDAVWPDDRLARLTGPDSARVDVLQSIAFRGDDALTPELRKRIPEGTAAPIAARGWRMLVTRDHAVAGLADGADLWLLEARGPSAAAQVARVAAGFRIERRPAAVSGTGAP